MGATAGPVPRPERRRQDGRARRRRIPRGWRRRSSPFLRWHATGRRRKARRYRGCAEARRAGNGPRGTAEPGRGAGGARRRSRSSWLPGPFSPRIVNPGRRRGKSEAARVNANWCCLAASWQRKLNSPARDPLSAPPIGPGLAAGSGRPTRTGLRCRDFYRLSPRDPPAGTRTGRSSSRQGRSVK